MIHLRLAAALLSTTALVSVGMVVSHPALGQVAPNTLPGGAAVASGGVSIGLPNANRLGIKQSTDNAVVNWQSFSIGSAARVDIQQPSSQAAILNRVTGGTPSTIAGQLNANGQVFLVNPNGIAITKSGTVNAGGFVASTLGTSDDDFRAGGRQFQGNGASAAVSNAGTITIGRGGYAALIGGKVGNSGSISVPLGKVGLGSGELATLDLSGDGFLQVAVPTGAGGKGALVSNTGAIRVHGGVVQMSAATAQDAARRVVNMSGVIEAISVSGRSGSIELSGGPGGAVQVSGKLDASSTDGPGGAVTVTGQQIALRGATLDVSGATGGGTVQVGGGRQGSGPLPHASSVRVDAKTAIRADATRQGTGGKVVVWSDASTGFAGRISASGGRQGGDGGQAEVSSRGVLAYTGTTDLRAARGGMGTLLLDPENVTISSAANANQSGFTAIGDNSLINAATLLAALGTANVTVFTGNSGTQAGTIAVTAPLAWNTGATLTLHAASSIALSSSINAAIGGLNLNSGGTITSTDAVSVARFALAAGNWVQNTATLPSFAAADFHIQGGSFLRATGGAGTSANPYTLADIYGLQGIGSAALLNASFQLATNIDASGTGAWNAGQGFSPIGNGTTPFTGNLDGAGHTVTGLTTNRPSQDYVGLVGFLGSGATLANLGLLGGSVSGHNQVGGLSGENHGSIAQANATGTVSGSGNVGGLVGYNNGSVAQAYATGAVNGSSSVGGLVGESDGSIVQAYATGAVSGAYFVGGLVGYNNGGNNGAVITQAYATGAANASGAYAGGLVGINSGSITQAYATGAVSGSASLGGLVGVDYGMLSSTYWDTATTGQSSSASSGNNPGATGLSTAQARNSASYAGFDFTTGWYQAGDLRPIGRWEAAAPVGGVVAVSNLHQLQLVDANLTGSYRLSRDIDASETAGANPAGVFGPGGFSPISNGATPFTGNLGGVGHTITSLAINRPNQDYVGLFGYTSGTVSNLGLLGGSISGHNYTGGLAGESDGTINQAYATGAVSGSGSTGGLVGYNQGSITQSHAAGAVSGSNFVGGLVGENDGSIAQAFATGNVSGSANDVGGLVGTNNSDLSLSYATGAVSGSSSVGGLVGSNTATNVAQVYATGAVTGSTSVGGLVGENYGFIVQAYATGAVSGSSAVGGLVGYNNSIVTQAYATGAVSGSNAVGGLVGENDGDGSINQAYATGAVSGQANLGGLIGTDNGTVSSAYWDTTATGQSSSSSGGNSPGTTGLTTAQMQDLSSYTATYAGFDFAGAWAPPNQIGQNNGSTNAYYPQLYSLANVVTVTPTSTSRFYGDMNPALAGSYTGLHAGDSISTLGSFNSTATSASSVGDYAISASNAAATSTAGQSYRFVYLPSSTLTVTQRPITVAADAQSRIYGEVNPTLTYSVGGSGLANGDTLSGGLATAATAASNVGAYAITQGSLAASGNYALNYVGANLGIIQRPLTVAADAQSRLYGNANPALTYSVGGSGLANGDTLSGGLATAATTASNVGAYAITQGSLAASGNYAVNYTGANLGITQRPLTVAADAQSRLYGNANPALTYSVGGLGLVNGDTLSGGLATAATSASNVGAYAITQGSLAASGNYALNYTGANLSITQRPLTVAADAQSRLYGNASPALTYSAGGLGLVNGDTLSGGLATSATSASNVGAYAITQGSLAASGNYALNYTGANLGITQRPLTVAADAQSRLYGNANPALTYSVGGLGLVNGDTLSGGLATSATSASNVGAYAITQGSLAASGNYAVNYVGANLGIIQRPPTVAAGAQSRMYGDLNPTLTYSVGGSGLVNRDTLSGGLATAATAASNVGAYTITQGSLAASGNYALNYTGANLSITQRPLTVAADAQSRLYGNANPALSYSVGGSGLANGGTLSGGLATAATAASSVGANAFTQSSLTASGNPPVQADAPPVFLTGSQTPTDGGVAPAQTLLTDPRSNGLLVCVSGQAGARCVAGH